MVDTGFIQAVVDDTSPQLGGDLDVNGQDIVSSGNADIDIIPGGTGDVNLGADTVQVGDNNADATITTQGTGDLILNTNDKDFNKSFYKNIIRQTNFVKKNINNLNDENKDTEVLNKHLWQKGKGPGFTNSKFAFDNKK